MRSTIFRRGQIWMADLGSPVGNELGFEYTVVIVSNTELINARTCHLICVPGTSTRFENTITKKVFILHLEVTGSSQNGLSRPTYFMSEQVRTLSCIRFRRMMGDLEKYLLYELEERLCLAMDLLSAV